MEINEILPEEILIEKCHESKIEAFETIEGFEDKEDVFLSDCDLDTLIKFCLINNLSSVFYTYVYPETEYYTIDKEKIKTALTKHYYNNRNVSLISIQYHNLSRDYYKSILDSMLDKVEVVENKQNDLIKRIDENIPEYFEVFACYNGMKVGFSLSNALIQTEDEEDEPDIYTTKMLYNKLSSELDKQISLQAEKAKEDNERIEQEKQIQYRKILSEIESNLQTDQRLLTIRYKNARQTYANMIKEEMESKYRLPIRKSDVQEIVENTYIKKTYK